MKIMSALLAFVLLILVGGVKAQYRESWSVYRQSTEQSPDDSDDTVTLNASIGEVSIEYNPVGSDDSEELDLQDSDDQMGFAEDQIEALLTKIGTEDFVLSGIYPAGIHQSHSENLLVDENHVVATILNLIDQNLLSTEGMKFPAHKSVYMWSLTGERVRIFEAGTLSISKEDETVVVIDKSGHTIKFHYNSNGELNLIDVDPLDYVFEKNSGFEDEDEDEDEGATGAPMEAYFVNPMNDFDTYLRTVQNSKRLPALHDYYGIEGSVERKKPTYLYKYILYPVTKFPLF